MAPYNSALKQNISFHSRNHVTLQPISSNHVNLCDDLALQLGLSCVDSKLCTWLMRTD